MRSYLRKRLYFVWAALIASLFVFFIAVAAQIDDRSPGTEATAGTVLLINEILFNPNGGDAPNEYVEIRGAANAVIPAGTYLVSIEGDSGGGLGDVQTIFDLSGMTLGSNGYLVLLQAGNSYTTVAGATVLTGTTTGFGGLTGYSADSSATDMENTTGTFLLIQAAAAPLLTDDIDSDNDGTPDGAVYAGWTIRDSIAVHDGDSVDSTYGNLTIADGTAGTATGTRYNDSFTAGYVGRRGDTTGSSPSEWVASVMLTGTGTAPNWDLGPSANMYPDSLAEAPLNHIGASNASFVPTAASVEVSGRVVNASGYGVAKARVSMTDQDGNTIGALTNGFGYYRLFNVASGHDYVVQVRSKQYRFTPRLVSVSDNITGLDLVAEP